MDLENYELQLQQVEKAIELTADDSDKAELLALRDNLLELLELTRETTSASNSDGALKDDSHRLNPEIEETRSDADSCDTFKTEQKLTELKSSLNEMVGQKCSAPHHHSWGAVAYHNAIVCGIENNFEMSDNGTFDIKLRVLFTNPTHREMLPCSYFLEGECRFDSDRCHYSHGELVSLNDLREYMTPEFERLGRNCAVLAKLDDRLWHRGRVICANFVDKSCLVRLDAQEHKKRERDFNFEDLFPMLNDDNSDDSNSDSSDSEDLDDMEAIRRARLVEESLFTFKPNQPLGEWEKHTRGIGSKLMSKMGYIHGTGLGSDGRGIIVPIAAQILPQGRSLDHCMELREAANGDANLFSVEKKLQQQKKKQEAYNIKAYEKQLQNKDVFSFLNETVFATEKSSNEFSKSKNSAKSSLQQHSMKELNLESVRVADDIRRKEREIAKVKESMQRNTQNADIHKQLEVQLTNKSNELAVLQKKEELLNKEKTTRKTKEKLTVF